MNTVAVKPTSPPVTHRVALLIWLVLFAFFGLIFFSGGTYKGSG